MTIDPMVFTGVQSAESAAQQSIGLKCRENAVKLASEKQIEVGQAHLEHARQLLISQSLKTQDTKKQDRNKQGATDNALQITMHLEFALAKQYQTEQCHAALGQIYLAAGDFAKSERHLSAAVNAQPEWV